MFNAVIGRYQTFQPKVLCLSWFTSLTAPDVHVPLISAFYALASSLQPAYSRRYSISRASDCVLSPETKQVEVYRVKRYLVTDQTRNQNYPWPSSLASFMALACALPQRRSS